MRPADMRVYNKNMNKDVIRNLVYSRVAFFGAMTICIILSQQAITTNQGLSYYGVTAQTLVPYAIGFLLSAYFVFRASFGLRKLGQEGKYVAIALRILAVLMIGVLVTPYAISERLYEIHVAISSLLFVVELLLAIWFVMFLRPDWINRLLGVAVFASGIVAFLSLRSTLRYMVAAQLIYELCFALMLLRSLKTFVEEKTKTTELPRVERK